MKELFDRHRPVIGYVLLAAGLLLALFLLRQETLARQRFDDRRAYEICLSGNERIKDINERFDKLDRYITQFSDPDDPKVKKFLADERSAEMKPRKCELRPQNSAGPQR